MCPEVLEELALTVQVLFMELRLSFGAFEWEEGRLQSLAMAEETDSLSSRAWR